KFPGLPRHFPPLQSVARAFQKLNLEVCIMSPRRKRFQTNSDIRLRFATTIALLAVLALALSSRQVVRPVQAVSSAIVISQVYGGGGNTGATYTNDFIEIFNRGASSVSLNGWAVQYASAS